MGDKIVWKEITLRDSEVWDRENPIEGTLVKSEEKIGPNESMMYTIKTAEGEVKVWGSTVLDDKLVSIPIGTYIKIEYEGKLKGRKGNEYHSYKAFIDQDNQGNEPSGYEKAKAQAEKLSSPKNRQEEDEPTPEMPPDFLDN